MLRRELPKHSSTAAMMRRMGSSSSAHDAKASPGYSQLLTGERLARMKACAEKASTSFPPGFVNKPQPEDEAHTPEGDDALARGRWANERRKPAPRDSGSLAAASRPAAPARSPTARAAGTGQIPAGFPTAAELDRELGGPDGCDTTASSREKRTLPRNRPQVLYALRAPLLQPLREPAHARALRHARPGHGGQRHGAARRPRRRRARSRRETDARERARNDARRRRDAREMTRKRRSSTRAK